MSIELNKPYYISCDATSYLCAPDSNDQELTISAYDSTKPNNFLWTLTGTDLTNCELISGNSFHASIDPSVSDVLIGKSEQPTKYWSVVESTDGNEDAVSTIYNSDGTAIGDLSNEAGKPKAKSGNGQKWKFTNNLRRNPEF
ncbi:MAG: hypothetical protein K9H61_06065 [Bacteroidia bacterium]|nr:hypothetical protein [Bacteroidia bacterium]MCF8425644.1 hypothetical protein [Bacteroidia bacterium]MCF8446544.1 hypothetical protein [Bacteroidia bacterium]